MAWSSADDRSSLTSVLNSTVSGCGLCQSAFPHSYAAALISVSLLALPLNGWAVWLLASSPITQKTDLFCFNLLVSDSLLNLSNVLIMSGVILFRQFSQHLNIFLLNLVAFGRPLSQCLICVERYLAVEHPVVFLNYRPLRYRAAIVALLWMLVAVYYSVSSALCAVQGDHTTQLLIFQSVVLLLIFVINSFCCISLLRALQRPTPGDGRKGRGGRKDTSDKIKKKAFVLVSMGQVYMVVCYLPPTALIFSHHVLQGRQNCTALMLNICFVLLASSMFCLHNLRRMGKLKSINCSRMR